MTTKIIECKGSLFSSSSELLCHGVNCKGIMGAGIAAQMKLRYPEMYKIYRQRCFASPRPEPGEIQICADKHSKKFIGNLFTQKELGACARVEYVEQCIDELIKANEGGDCPGLYLESVAFPRIGCGIGGLEWEEVKPVLHKLTKFFKKVEVWSL